MRFAMLLLVLGFALSAALGAQAPFLVTPGQRVRVSLNGGHRQVAGMLVAQDGDSISVQSGADTTPLAIARADVAVLEVSTSRHSNAGSGAVVGLFGGGLWGIMVGASCQGQWVCPGPAAAGATLGVFCALIGGAIGALSHSENWQSVYERRAHVSLVAPARGRGIGVGVAVAF